MADKWNMIVDVARCENCHNCVLATKDETVDNAFPGYSAPQPRHGHDWIKLTRQVRGRGHMVDTAYLPSMCNHCDDAPCVAAGGGCVTKRADGIVLIDPDRAKGRRDLLTACPYGAIYWNAALSLPQHWTFDAHLLDQRWQELRASQACPTGALETVKLADPAMQTRARAEALETLPSDTPAKPRVWYKNLHRFTKAFLGGTVLAQSAEGLDVIVGAKVTLTEGGVALAETITDSFGDFKFDGLNPDGRALVLLIQHGPAQQSRSVTLTDTTVLDPVIFAPA